MRSLLSHIRGRPISHPAPTTSHQDILPPTPALSYGVDSSVETSPEARYVPGRRILENPSSFLDVPDDSVSLTHSLSPSIRRHSGGGLRNTQRAKFISETVAETDEPVELLEPPNHSIFIDRPLQLAADANWSTFGRQRVRSPSIAPEFSDHGHAKDTTKRNSYSHQLKRDDNNTNCKGSNPTGSSHSITTFGNVSLSSLAPHDIPAHTSNDGSALLMPVNNVISNPSIDSKPSHTDEESSRHHVQTPNKPNTTPTAYLTTPVLRELGFDSPGTFGHPTPENRSTFTFTQPSPPPPLPPLSHPALSYRLEDKGAVDTTSGFSEEFSTFPKHSSRVPSSIGDGFASLSMSFSRSVRHFTSLPTMQHVFPSSSEEQPVQQPRPRARTISDKSRHHRRDSASWSAQQATEGVNSSSNTAWPAEVSREILRLSLGEGFGIEWPSRSLSGIRGPEWQTAKEDEVATRGNNVGQFPNQAPISRSFSPSLSPRRRRSPIPQGGDHIPQSLHLNPLLHSTIHTNPRMPVKSNGAYVIQDGATSPDRASSRLDVPVGRSKAQGRASSQFLFAPSTVKSTPARTPRSNMLDPSTPTPTSRNLSDTSKGKRKAEDIETTPPEQKKDTQRTTFAVPESNRSQKLSGSSHAPSSYHRKRARLSSASPFSTPVQSRPGSLQGQTASLQPTPELGKFGSWSSHTSAGVLSTPRAPSRATSARSIHPQQTPNKTSHTPMNGSQNHAKRQSISQLSIPISALVSPHAPSITPSGKFHMRDPRRPPKKLADTPWTLHFATEDEPRSPVHAWCFFLGFILFPAWWIAALFLRTPGTRVVGDEKGMSLDDPQIEHDAKAWRFRCRLMSVVSLFTYIPFIVLVVIYAGR